MKTLIAEDDLTSRLMLGALLKKWGYEPEVVENGRQAWERMQKADAPKLLLLDWNMPEMDGLQVTQKLRSLGGSEAPYVILLTARGEKNDIVRGLAAGANDYVLKPYDQDELRARLEVGRRTVELIAKLIRSQKMAGLGTLAAGMAHEINSPLQVIIGDSQEIGAWLKMDQPDHAEIAQAAERIHSRGWRIAKIVRSLQDYARTSPAQFAPAPLNALVRDALVLMEYQISAWQNMEVRTELADRLPDLLCDRNQIIQVVLNLVTNAHDAMPDGGTLTLSTALESQPARLSLTVRDTGAGVPDAIRSRIFDPFFTTKPMGQGTGLGLSIAQGIMRAHNGEITVSSPPGQGAAFTLAFPLTAPEGKSPAAATEARFDD